MFISRSNPVVQLPDSEAAEKAIKDIEFKVVLDHFMTDTAKLADIVLPVTYFMEETDIICSSMWNGYINYNEKLVPRYCETKPEFEIYSLLAEKMGIKEFPQMNEEQWIDILLSTTAEIGLNLKALMENKYAKAAKASAVAWEDGKFKTPSGKFEFIDLETLKKSFVKPINPYSEGFRLLTVHTRETLHSQHMMTSDREVPLVYISNEDALELNIESKQLVELYNRYGKLTAETSISDKCQKGVLYMREGWWKKNGGSVNSLTPHEASDIGLQAVYNECICKIRKQEA
jgi:anaerobic selenocysteine-containing dehydrogenase